MTSLTAGLALQPTPELLGLDQLRAEHGADVLRALEQNFNPDGMLALGSPILLESLDSPVEDLSRLATLMKRAGRFAARLGISATSLIAMSAIYEGEVFADNPPGVPADYVKCSGGPGFIPISVVDQYGNQGIQYYCPPAPVVATTTTQKPAPVTTPPPPPPTTKKPAPVVTQPPAPAITNPLVTVAPPIAETTTVVATSSTVEIPESTSTSTSTSKQETTTTSDNITTEVENDPTTTVGNEVVVVSPNSNNETQGGDKIGAVLLVFAGLVGLGLAGRFLVSRPRLKGQGKNPESTTFSA